MYWFLCLVSSAISKLSYKTLDRIARFLGFLVFDLFRVRRKLVLKNLQIAFGDTKSEAERRRIGRESVNCFILTCLEFLHSYGNDIAADVTITGLEHFKTALAKGKGAYCLCFHMASWDAQAATMTRNLTRTCVISKKVGSEGTNRFINELRLKNDYHPVVKTKKGEGFAAIRETLGRGDILAFAIDQARPGAPKLKFFGKPAKTNTSLAAIWRKIPAPIVPAFARRIAPGKHEIIFWPEVEMVATDDQNEDIVKQSLVFNQIVEKAIRFNPEQYFWMHNRWKQ